MTVSDTKYNDAMNGLKTLMEADPSLSVDGTYGVKQISAGEPLRENEYVAIQIFVIGDRENDEIEGSFELGGSGGNIYHRVMEFAINIYQAWEEGYELNFFTGATMHGKDGASITKYGLYQIAAYMIGFLTSNYTINNTVFVFKWTDTKFVAGTDTELPYANISAEAFYNEQL